MENREGLKAPNHVFDDESEASIACFGSHSPIKAKQSSETAFAYLLNV